MNARIDFADHKGFSPPFFISTIVWQLASRCFREGRSYHLMDQHAFLFDIHRLVRRQPLASYFANLCHDEGMKVQVFGIRAQLSNLQTSWGFEQTANVAIKNSA